MFKIKTITGDYSEVLLNSIKEQVGLECFKFSDMKQIEKLIKLNYKNVNEETMLRTMLKIMIFNLDNDFETYKEKDEKIDLCQLTQVKTEYISLFDIIKAKFIEIFCYDDEDIHSI